MRPAAVVNKCSTWNIPSHEMDTLQQFVHDVEKLGHRLDAREIELFDRYLAEILRVNGQFGLISRNDQERIPTRHFLDSVMPVVMGHMPTGGTIIDMGSGGGLPGIPLAILAPGTSFVLVDSNRRKCVFLRQVKRVLSLRNVNVCNTRMENLPLQSPDVLYDGAVSRAVGSVAQLAGWCGGVLKPGRKLICYKGPEPEAEIESAEQVMEMQRLEWEGTYSYDEARSDSPSLVVLRKQHEG